MNLHQRLFMSLLKEERKKSLIHSLWKLAKSMDLIEKFSQLSLSKLNIKPKEKFLQISLKENLPVTSTIRFSSFMLKLILTT